MSLSVGPHLTHVAWAEAYLRTKWRLDTSTFLPWAEKWGTAVPPFLGELGTLSPGRKPPPYQVAS